MKNKVVSAVDPQVKADKILRRKTWTNELVSREEYAELCRLRSRYLQACSAFEKTKNDDKKDEMGRLLSQANVYISKKHYADRLRELHARVTKPAPKLFDVTYFLPNRSIQTLAVDREDACDTAASYADLQFKATPAKSMRRGIPLFDDHGLVQTAGSSGRRRKNA